MIFHIKNDWLKHKHGWSLISAGPKVSSALSATVYFIKYLSNTELKPVIINIQELKLKQE